MLSTIYSPGGHPGLIVAGGGGVAGGKDPRSSGGETLRGTGLVKCLNCSM